MILMDFSQIFLATLHASLGGHTNAVIDESMLRHMALNSIRFNNKKFGPKYGELTICMDSRKNWRKEAFPYYKARRALSREESELDWGEIFRVMEVIKNELRENFTYKILEVEGLEADDIIGTLVHKYGTPLMSDPILIISGDKDYQQLQVYGNVDQWDPVLDRWLQTSSAEEFLFKHVCKGDGGDDIPNIRSAENSYMLKIRQKPITEIMLKKWRTDGVPAELQPRFDLNQKLIDLKFSPPELQQKAIDQYLTPKPAPQGSLLNYFMKHRLRNLMEYINDF